MKPRRQERPLSYLKTNMEEALRMVSGGEEVLVLMDEGEPQAVLQDAKSWQEMQDALALLQILALSAEEVSQGHARPMEEVFAKLRKEVRG